MTTGGATAAATDTVAGARPNCWRISWFTSSELSWPQAWQTKRIGELAISGVTSKAYFAPQLHWIFMGGLDLRSRRISPKSTPEEAGADNPHSNAGAGRMSAG